MSEEITKTAQILEIGVLAERKRVQESVIPAMQKINLTGALMMSTYRVIKEHVFTPNAGREYRKKRLAQLAGELAEQVTNWRNAYAMNGLSVDSSELRLLMSDLQDAITNTLESGKLTRLTNFFRRYPADEHLFALADQYSTRDTDWTLARLWIANELHELKKVRKVKGSYKTLSTLYLLPQVVDTKKDLFAGKHKLTADDRIAARELIEYEGTSNNYFVDLVYKLKLREKHRL